MDGVRPVFNYLYSPVLTMSYKLVYDWSYIPSKLATFCCIQSKPFFGNLDIMNCNISKCLMISQTFTDTRIWHTLLEEGKAQVIVISG